MYRFVIVLVAGMFAAAVSAQDQDKAPAIQEKVKSPTVETKGLPKTGVATKAPMVTTTPGEVEINFLNGSTVRMILQADKVDVATPYGPLAIPSTQIKAIEFGLHFPEGMDAKIQQAVKNLGGENFRDRDLASKALVELGPYSYAAVLAASQSAELEVSRRAKDVVKQLVQRHPKKDLKASADDRVVTPTFTIVGRIQNTTIKANAELFGQVDLPVSKMRMLRSLFGGRDVDVTIDAAKYASQGQWLETDFVVDGRTEIIITASGLVDTWPQQGGQYIVGPNGLQGRNMGMAFNPAMMAPGRKLRGPLNGQIYGGALLGKIGDDGETFMIGEKYEGTPEASGKLFLHVGPSPWNTQCTGTYDVKIGRK